MADKYATPGVPEPEDSARRQREKTQAQPDTNNVSAPRCYEQCVEASKLPDNKVAGDGPAYQG